MRLKHFFITLFFQIAASLSAQDLTIEEGKKIADRLFEVKLLSVSGRDTLKDYLKNGPTSFGLNGCIIQGDEQQKILTFCAMAFAAEEASRNGMLEVYGPWVQNGYQQNFDTLYKYFKEKELYKFSGYLIENNILTQEPQSRYPDKTIEEILGSGIFAQRYLGINSINTERSVTGKHRLKTLEDYRSLGLIDEDIYKEGLEKINSNEINSELKLTEFVWERVQFYKIFLSEKEAQIKDIYELRKLGLLSESNTAKLLASYKPCSLLTGQEIFSARSDVVFLESKNLPRTPEKAYEIIFQQIKTIVPDFNYRKLQVRFVHTAPQKNFREKPGLDAVISLKIKGKTYKHRYFYMYLPDHCPPHFQPATFVLNTDYVHVVNRWLRDINAASRLGAIGFSDTCHGLILCTQGINKPYDKSYPYITKDWHCGQVFFSPMDYLVSDEWVSNFNKEDIQRFIKNCKKAGLFTHLSYRQIISAEKCVYKKLDVGYSSILKCFPGILFRPIDDRDMEFREMWRLLKGVEGFELSDILEFDFLGKGGKAWHLSFKIHDKFYSTIYDYSSISKVKTLMHEALQGVNEDLDIYKVNDNDGIIILTKSQYEYLNRVETGVFIRW